MLESIIHYGLFTVGDLWLTWVWFSAVMRWRELHDQGKLDSKHLIVRWLIYINLAIGFILDASCNILISPLIFELPRYDLTVGSGTHWYNREFLLTNRLIRWHHSTQTNWFTVYIRQGIWVALGQQLLDIVDTSGVHIT